MNKNNLKIIFKIETLIKHKRLQIERLRSLAESVTSHMDITGIKGTGEREDVRLKIIELEEELNRAIDLLIDTKLEMMERIDKLENHHTVDILYMRYFEHLGWKEIADKKEMSLDWIFKLHREGLKNL